MHACYTVVVTYTRQPSHWQTDTTNRKVFEREVSRALRADGEFELLDSTESYDEVDFELGCRGRRVFLEIKEKRQRYREAWLEASGVKQEVLFILDELSARKIILRAPRAYLLVKDQVQDSLVLFGALELITLPKTRINRSINGGVATFKGKWLIDLRHGKHCEALTEVFDLIKRRSSSEEELWSSLACHGRYEDEDLGRL